MYHMQVSTENVGYTKAVTPLYISQYQFSHLLSWYAVALPSGEHICFIMLGTDVSWDGKCYSVSLTVQVVVLTRYFESVLSCELIVEYFSLMFTMSTCRLLL